MSEFCRMNRKGQLVALKCRKCGAKMKGLCIEPLCKPCGGVDRIVIRRVTAKDKETT